MSAAADTVRAFFAVELGESARRAAAAAAGELRRRDERGAVRFTRPESLHVTLRFLGDVATGQLGGLVACVAKEAARVAPFALRLGALVAFPTARRPRVLAVEALPAAALARAAAAVERGCVAAGFAPEARPFRGHLTLGRVKRGPGRAMRARTPRFDDVAVPDHEPTPVRDAVLFASELHRDGARYTPLERVPFGGATDDSEPRL
ncbi:MAG TPA: RNA 2',3'-cyclic phosphodiesterase [Myxococcota bacterium]|nr:RNA 2',3'-cyclic phosphodiesterase [Myxococcota bacterium]